MPNENAYGHGGLLTTAEDLLLWNKFYLNNKLGTAPLLEKQKATSFFSNGKLNNYAAGLVIDSVNGWAAISHSGATAGYRGNLEYFPQTGLSFAWVSNNALGSMADIPYSIRNLVVKNLRPATVPTRPSPVIDVKKFIPYLGAYRNIKTGNGIRIYLRDTLLYSDPDGKLIPLSLNSAAVGHERIIFSDKPKKIQFITENNNSKVYEAVDRANITDKNIQEFAGIYYSDETESKTTIIIKNGKLVAKVRSNEMALVPVYKDGFSFPGGDVYFERNKQGKISKMFISISRARKVEFSKESLLSN